MAALSIPTLPLRLVRSAVGRFREEVARRTAPPVVLAVRAGGLSPLDVWALAEVHEQVMAADEGRRDGVVAVVGDGGAAVVAADARVSAREVCVYGVDDRAALAETLAAHGSPPETSRVTLHDGAPAADGPAVAVGFVAAGHLGALGTLAGRLAPGGALVVADGEAEAVAEVLGRGGFRSVQRAGVWVVRRD